MGRLILLANHPLSVLWVLAAIGVAGGIIEWVFLDRSPWEGFGAAGVIAGVIQVVARVKGVTAWPWQPQSVAHESSAAAHDVASGQPVNPPLTTGANPSSEMQAHRQSESPIRS